MGVDPYKQVWAYRVKTREHVVLAELALGRPLDADEHVHHVNEDKRDNRLENLEVLTPSEHQLRHHLKYQSPNERLEARREQSREFENRHRSKRIQKKREAYAADLGKGRAKARESMRKYRSKLR